MINYVGLVRSSSTQVFGHDLTASDLMLYVVPEKRGSTIAHGIIKKYEEWAISQNVTEISLGISDRH